MTSSSVATAPHTTPQTTTNTTTKSVTNSAMTLAGAGAGAGDDAAQPHRESGAVGDGRRRRFLRRSSRPRRQPLRQHGQPQPFDRRELESSGWRTTLEYRENHGRGRDGRLECLEAVWCAEAERVSRNGTVRVVSAVANTQARAWSRLRAAADLADVKASRTPAASP